MNQLINSLKEFQSNSVVFYHLVHGFHWNTESTLMRQSRIIFEEIYKDVWESLHETSEWLRRLGAEAPYTLEEFSYHQTLGNVKPNTYCGVEMTMHLIPINEKMIVNIKDLLEQAYIKKEFGLVQFLSDRLKSHQTWNWQMTSHLKWPPNPWKSLKD